MTEHSPESAAAVPARPAQAGATASGSPGRWKRRSLAVGLGLLVTFAAAEIGARALVAALPVREMPHPPGKANARQAPIERVSRKELRYALQPGASSAMVYPAWSPGEEERTVVYQINADGFRDRLFARPKPVGTFRIALIGDSFTFGNGVVLKDTLPKVLERELAELVPPDAGPTIEVMNCGTGGYDTRQEVELLEWRVLPFEPDLVVIVYYLNDVFPQSGAVEETEVWQGRWAARLATLLGSRREGRGEGAPAGDVALGFASTPKVAGSQLLGLFAQRLKKDLTSRALHANLKRLYAPDSAQWQRVVQALQKAERLAREHDFSVHLVLYPDLPHVADESYPFAEFEAQVLAAARELGIAAHDVAGALAGHTPAELTAHPADPHGSALCNELLGRALARELASSIPGER